STNPVAINDADPSVANVKNGSYPIFRPLNMLTNGAPSDLADAFISFILGPQGQETVSEDYITVK
ncbi:MAG: phosphate-binding protein, partial [Anaerolineae bacterium]|nr:phosphate-binding protein [Anaerolineae bacterium]